MLRQCAFTGSTPLLKGCLHSHSTRSDGKDSPQEVLRAYHAQGYDFVALSDHRIYNYTHFAPETGLTLIPAMEMDRSLPGPGTHCFHTVCLGPEKAAGNGYAQDEVFARGAVADQHAFQPLLDEIHAHHNLTLYCHPQWSGTPAREFEQLKGNFALEVWNSGCAIENGCDTDAPCWDELLGQGIRIFGAATDDGHQREHIGKGWVRVNSRNQVSAILEALERGAFYASCGPEIFDFYVESGEARLSCSPCAAIRFICDKVPSRMLRGEGLTRGSFPLRDFCTYVRAAVTDSRGRMAWTNPIWLGDDA